MKIKFTGTINLPYADDMGSYDIWLINTIQDIIEAGPETDDIYDKLSLSWKPIDKEKNLEDYSDNKKVNMSKYIMLLQAIVDRQQKASDEEADHAEADKILCNILEELGQEDIVEIYEQISKWYA